MWETRVRSLGQEGPWRRQWHPTPVLLPGKSHGRRSLVGLQSKGLLSLLQHHNSKASILQRSAFFTVQLSNPYMTTGKSIALTRRTFVGKVMSLLLNMLYRLVITFLPRSKSLLISWLQSPFCSDFGAPQNKVSHYFHCFPIHLP